MDSASWTKRIEAATSQTEVIQLVRQYLETRDARDIAFLPADCRPTRLHTGDDVADVAYRLAVHQGHDDQGRVIQRLGGVVSRAAVRIAELSSGR